MSQSLTIALGFIEGIGLVVSPCILPILPLILSGSLTGGRKRPLGIIAGFVVFFALFTFFSRALIQHIGVDPLRIREVSYGILCVLGVVMLSEKLTDGFMRVTAGLMRFGGIGQGDGFWSGVLFGGVTAVLWTPCAGPILAAVIVQTALQQAGWDSFLIVLAFGLGAAVPMLLVALFGRAVIQRVSFLKTHTVLLRKALGGIVLLAVGWMVYTDTAFSFSSVQPTDTTEPTVAATGLQKALSSPYPAPEIAGISLWLNSPPLQISNLRGKVVLIDFWTYSCINCIRTLPYLHSWYEKYHDRGLVIIGVSTPEFEFEKNPDNVTRAVKADGILYPVALDNAYKTWLNFNNHYWPAHYLINKEGQVVYQAFGEGDYEVTENNIRYLLQVGSDIQPTKVQPTAVRRHQTPETYFGYARAKHFAGDALLQHDVSATYVFPETLSDDAWALSGQWRVYPDRIVAASSGAALRIQWAAGQVFLVMGSAGQPVPVTFLYEGNSDHQTVRDHRLYTVIEKPQSKSGLLEIRADQPGLEIYTATFGS